jgi:tetratricopeptide (TPR) repeat protein
MIHPYTQFVSLLLATTVAATVQGNDALWPTDSLGHALWQDLSDNKLDQHDLLSAALIAGGVTDVVRLDHAKADFQQLANQCRQRLVNKASQDMSPGIVIFHSLHEQALTGSFCDAAWQIDRTMQGGPFNCVTSSVLYLCLCRQFDIRATAIAQHNHVYCRLIGETSVDVQTTCPEWFDDRGLPRVNAMRGVPVGQPRTINAVQLLGKIYYNRAVSLSVAKQCRPAIDHLRRAVHLDCQDAAARQNLLAAMNNGALQLSDDGRYRQAAQLVCEGLRLAPDHDELLANDLHVHQQWALELCTANRFAEAVEILEECHQRRGDVELFELGRWCVYQSWAESLIERNRVADVHDLFASAHDRYGDHPELRACETAVWSRYPELRQQSELTSTASP